MFMAVGPPGQSGTNQGGSGQSILLKISPGLVPVEAQALEVEWVRILAAP